MLHPTCRLAELFSQTFVEIALSNPRYSKIETFTGFANGFAKEFTFGRVDERVRGEDVGKRRQRTARGQEDGRPYYGVVAIAQFVEDLYGRYPEKHSYPASGSLRPSAK